MLTLFIPGTPKNANAKGQWARHSANRDRQKFRKLAHDEAARHYEPHGTFTDFVRITARQVSKVSRRRDPTGLAERLKGILDGIVDSNLLIDDDEDHIELVLAHSVKGPTAGIELTIESLGASPA